MHTHVNTYILCFLVFWYENQSIGRLCHRRETDEAVLRGEGEHHTSDKLGGVPNVPVVAGRGETVATGHQFFLGSGED